MFSLSLSLVHLLSLPSLLSFLFSDCARAGTGCSNKLMILLSLSLLFSRLPSLCSSVALTPFLPFFLSLPFLFFSLPASSVLLFFSFLYSLERRQDVKCLQSLIHSNNNDRDRYPVIVFLALRRRKKKKEEERRGKKRKKKKEEVILSNHHEYDSRKNEHKEESLQMNSLTMT